MFNQPAICKPLKKAWHAQAGIRWLAVWLIGIVIGLPLMVLIARMGGEHAVNALVRMAIVAINGPALQSYLFADALSLLLSMLIPGAASGALIGFAQSILLPNQIQSTRWIFASACAGAFAWCAANALFIPMQYFTIVSLRSTFIPDIGVPDILIAALVAGSTVGALGGVIAGSVQWLLLRRVNAWAVWWIIASAIGWSSMWAVGEVVLAIIALWSPIIIN